MQIKLSEHYSYSKLIRFTIPTIAMMIFTSIYGVVDGIFVSNIAGSDAFAAINLILPVIMIFGSVGFMLGTGGSALVSKTLGEKKDELANQYFSMLIYFVIISGIILSILGFIFTPAAMRLMGADGQIFSDGILYGRILYGFLVFFMMQNAFQSFLVVAEKPTFGLLISIISGISNMLLDFLFVYVFRMGLVGAALATGISQVVGVVIPVTYFVKENSKLRLIKTGLKCKPIIRSCSNGSSEMLNNISMSLVSMLYNIQLMKYIGSDGVVAYGIIMYVSFIFTGVYMGYSIGAAPILGYHYGANNTNELKSLFKKSIIMISASSVILTVMSELSAGMLAKIFVSYDKELLEMTVIAIRLYSISFMAQGINVFASAFFTALNNGIISALLAFLRTFVFQIIMIFVLPLIWEVNGIWLAVVFAEILAIIVSILCFIIERKKYNYL